MTEKREQGKIKEIREISIIYISSLRFFLAQEKEKKKRREEKKKKRREEKKNKREENKRE